MFHRFIGLSLVLGIMLLAPSALAKGSVTPKTKLKTALKKIAKAKYTLKMNVEGGISSSKDHKISECTYRGDFSGDVYKGIMKLSTPQKAFRNIKKGAYQEGQLWKDVESQPKMRELHRLFKFPESILASALTCKGKMEWIAGNGIGGKKEEAKKSDGTQDDEDQSTSARKDKADKENEKSPNRIRVIGNHKESIKRFIEIENSGCVSGG